ncbi:hypothetical protein SPRG_09420 [Saprolegnia parasitica CBS 223.65]|uniref:RING-type domain-containing protein n=1 Tax=Saprolegnia parasitica (strain CBS 223.65) TaxID=695850 RepID=A0A067CF76_SAPPC|nr:hypothetical protein SPRG_09420 [Saprolegnia parasitica CBS 223.65]KDO25477.1 hypothetical protein SPRG_09420 [Saprolegnia parasitica CBS 223.65]|eukprot:XP_012203902.1 hypothetical protein SPRG_09420 [Saprolegnia parasitica CBS 223.65]
MGTHAAPIDLSYMDDDSLLDEYDDDEAKPAPKGHASKPTDANDLDDDDDADDDEMCSICLDAVTLEAQGHLLKCVHCFHFECIFRWAKVTNLCPMCKTRFTSIVQKNVHGVITKRTPIKHAKQVHDDDSSADLAHASNLLNEFACMLCGNGDSEETLLLCDADNCEAACHTLCLGLPGVPAQSWFCPEHEHRRSSARRQATTLASLRASRSGRTRRSVPLRRRTPLETRLGVRRGQRVPLPFEREVSQYYSSEPAYHPRSVASTEMRRMQEEAARILERTPATAALKRKREADAMWAESARARQMMTLTPHATPVVRDLPPAAAAAPAPRASFRSQFVALRDAMRLAEAKDASTAVYNVPAAAKLRLLPQVKSFFEALNPAQQRQVLEWQVLPMLKAWLSPYGPGRPQHQLVMDGLLTLLAKLPISKEHLKQSDGLGHLVLQLTKDPGPCQATARIVLDKWKQLVAKPAAVTSTVARRPPPPMLALPVITPMVPSSTTKKSPSAALKTLPYCDVIVQFVKQLVYPRLRDGRLARDRFTAIVKETSNAFAAEVPHLSAPVVDAGTLTPFAQRRLTQLVERALL